MITRAPKRADRLASGSAGPGRREQILNRKDEIRFMITRAPNRAEASTRLSKPRDEGTNTEQEG